MRKNGRGHKQTFAFVLTFNNGEESKKYWIRDIFHCRFLQKPLASSRNEVHAFSLTVLFLQLVSVVRTNTEVYFCVAFWLKSEKGVSVTCMLWGLMEHEQGPHQLTKAATATHTAFRAEVRDRLDPRSQALLESQTGPHASRAFTAIPYHYDNSYSGPPLPPASLAAPPIATALICPLLPVPSRSRPSWRPPRGLCAVWTLATTGGGPGTGSSPHKAGARVTTNTRVVDLNLEHLDRQDARRIEVIASGLPLWGGNQLAVDTTLVSPLTREGAPRQRWGDLRRGSSAGCSSQERANIPSAEKNNICNFLFLYKWTSACANKWTNDSYVGMQMV